MIEKIPFETENIRYNDKTLDVQTHASPYDLQIKINEIIELLNAIVVDVDGTKCIDGSKKAEPEKCKAPVDPYEKQRNWISKLCRFRDKHSDVWEYGTLEAVEDVDHAIDCAFRSSDGYWYDICEPVKPDDDIIYKG